MNTQHHPHWHMKSWLLALVLFILLLIVHPLAAAATCQPQPSPGWMDLYGNLTAAKPGDRLEVTNQSGSVCGVMTLTTAGKYGFIHVYALNNSAHSDQQSLTFYLNDRQVESERPVTYEAQAKVALDLTLNSSGQAAATTPPITTPIAIPATTHATTSGSGALGLLSLISLMTLFFLFTLALWGRRS